MPDVKPGFLYRLAAKENLEGSESVENLGACPLDSDIMCVALEQAEPERVAVVEQHAANCESCGEALQAIRLALKRQTPPLEPWNDPVAAWLAKGGGVTKATAEEP